MVALIAICAVSGAIAGAVILPWACDALLKKKRREYTAWWLNMLREYSSWMIGNPEREPSPKASGEEGALGIWLSDNRRLYRIGELTKEQYESIKELGIEL